MSRGAEWLQGVLVWVGGTDLSCKGYSGSGTGLGWGKGWGGRAVLSPSTAPTPMERGLVWGPGEGQELGRGQIPGQGASSSSVAAECRNQTHGTGRGALVPQPPPLPSGAHSLEGTGAAPAPPPPQDSPAGPGVPGGGTGGRVFDTARGIYFTAATQRRGPGQPRKHNMRGGMRGGRGGAAYL